MKFLHFIIFYLNLNLISCIFNGTIAEPHQFPYIVLVISPQFFCAGSLISTKHIITAAHCLMSIQKGDFAKIYLGAQEFRGGEKILSDKFWIHEKFSMPSAVNDIGLIELPNEIKPSKNVNFIEIDTRLNVDYDESDREVVIGGWGYYAPQVNSFELRFTTMKLISLNECKKYNKNYIESLTENHICVEKIKNLPCDGDSGAGLVSSKSHKLIGVLSFVKDAENGHDIHSNDCQSRVPAVATRIQSYLQWISEKSGLKF